MSDSVKTRNNNKEERIENAQALLLVGLSKPVTAGRGCGVCGCPTCAGFAKNRTLAVKEMGIPMGVFGKSIFFDRQAPVKH